MPPKPRGKPASRDASAPVTPLASRKSWKSLALPGAAGVGLIALLAWAITSRSAAEPPEPTFNTPATYVGSTACATCHTAQAAEWGGSQHAAAMAVASETTVAGRFDGTSFTHRGVTSTFFRRDGKFHVRTDGADGRITDFEIAYTFGVAPLQQYLVALPGGRYQALSIAWDTRPAADGGQRWFHLYPQETIAAGDPLHWTGRLQNWNFMCADCHSTNLRKGYDQASRTFATTWSEISVGCEACHGPGSEHVAQAGRGAPADGFGLAARLTERRGVTWTFDRDAHVPRRSHARTTDIEIETCARCHSRREQLTDDWRAGEVFENAFRPALVTSPLYHPDGQQRDEVYNYGSFLQSRMYASGVTCSDCHNPHNGKLRLPGNATCTQCHQDARYDSPAHQLHQAGSTGASCVSCHMPTTTYMVVDPRRDHSFSVPRPEQSAALGVPNACAACHSDRSASWAATQIARIERVRSVSVTIAAPVFGASDRGTSGGDTPLWELASSADQPAILRASALTRLSEGPRAPAGFVLDGLLRDSSAMVRRSALAVVRLQDEPTRTRLATPLLTDPVRTVRIAAANALVDLADRLPAGDRDRFELAFSEGMAEQSFNADRPEAQVNIGTAWMARGRLTEAAAAFREAIALDPAFEAAYVNLADVYRAEGQDASALALLVDAVNRVPSSAAVRHSLGLALVRQRRLTEAIEQFSLALRAEPASARYAYVYAVALNDAGRTSEALVVLRNLLVGHPDDADALVAAALYSERAGRVADARGYASRLMRLRPNDPAARDLLRRIGSAQ